MQKFNKDFVDQIDPATVLLSIGEDGYVVCLSGENVIDLYEMDCRSVGQTPTGSFYEALKHNIGTKDWDQFEVNWIVNGKIDILRINWE